MITERQIELLHQSCNVVKSGDTQATARMFYNCLFELAPEVQPIFAGAATKEQSGKFLSLINHFTMYLDNPYGTSDDIAALARQHVGYGVQEEQYTMVGRALLWTIQTVLGDSWNKELRQAWILAYTMLAESMIKASEYKNWENQRVY